MENWIDKKKNEKRIEPMIKDPEVEQAVIKDLAEAVIIQAVKDLKNSRYEQQLDAFYFLAGDDLPMWLAVALDDNPDVLTNAGVNALASGRIKKQEGEK